ncbi:NAD-dependent epimerase/dehydratase family protein [Aquabacterium sp. J223]|uniref:NAD-dependent epimerase/dehydratase family protein n=1 Tax=Aquabacterium sp. J223 TaxID=2898431 RepID=UPI0021ADE816|nr:NAD(P)-dependent oxidoreductase [Aquabacterium sp. J223]UUX96775.1 NAD(P)-dependent oxidoreductase [Aquabacterium sp. J223]
MKILLTGGSGFLGSALACALHDRGDDVALLLRRSSDVTRLGGRGFDIERPSDDEGVAAFVSRLQPDAIVHTACSYGRQGEGLLQLQDANVRLGLALLQATLALPPSGGPRLFLNTGTALPPTVGPYALSKHHFTDWGRQQASTAPDRLRFINVQLEHMYGPGDDESKFTSKVIEACRTHAPALPLTAGEQRRDFIYIDDVVQAYATLLDRAGSFGPTADVPVGCGTAPTVREFVETVHRLCGSRTDLRFGAVPYRANEPMCCQADLTSMHRLGWKPRWTLEDGLKRTLGLDSRHTRP